MKNASTDHRCQHHVDVVDAGQSEIGQFDVTGCRDQDVLGLQIAVNDAVGMQEIHSAQDLIHDILRRGSSELVTYAPPLTNEANSSGNIPVGLCWL